MIQATIRQLLPLASVWAIASSLAVAGDYRVELNASHADTDLNIVEASATGLSLSYYLAPVQQGDEPHAEAAFVSRASSISAGVSRGEIDPAVGADIDSDDITLGFHYVIPDTGIIVGMNYRNIDEETVDYKGYGFKLGYYLTDTSTLVLGISQLEDDTDGVYYEQDSYRLDYRYLWMTDSLSLAIEAAVGRNEFELNDEANPDQLGSNWVEVALVHYATDALSFRLGQAVSHQDIKTTEIFGGVEYFITPRLAVGLELFTIKDDDTDERGDGWTLNLTGRF